MSDWDQQQQGYDQNTQQSGGWDQQQQGYDQGTQQSGGWDQQQQGYDQNTQQSGWGQQPQADWGQQPSTTVSFVAPNTVQTVQPNVVTKMDTTKSRKGLGGLTGESIENYSETWRTKANNYCVNDGTKTAVIGLWALATIFVFAERVYYYIEIRDDVFGVLSHGVTIARGAAAAIKLNAALLLLTVLRNVITWLRGTFLGTYFPFDKNIVFHRYLAWTILVLAAAHIVAHYFNFNTLSNLETIEDLTVFGFQDSGPPKSAALAFSTLPGATGSIVVIIMALMYSSAVKYVRGPQFNVFWYTHHLFILFYLILCVHGGAVLLEKPSFWIWTLGPMIFYAIERTIRVIRGAQETALKLAIAHPSRVIELQLKKNEFKYQSGQYLFLNCPYLAAQEWHPFTISSAPEEECVSVHIRIVGDWTGDLWNYLNPKGELGIIAEDIQTADDGSSIFKIDGPFGAASQDIFDFQTVMAIGAGVGVTPFASILKHIQYNIETKDDTRIKKVYFFWINRDKSSFEWFSDLLANLEKKNLNNFLEIHVYLTASFKLEDVRAMHHGAHSGSGDAITGLQTPTNYGRPNWGAIYSQVKERHEGTDIGVFFCGPAVLSKQLYKNCRRFTDVTTNTRFVYHKENF